jgi:hypothetical protein
LKRVNTHATITRSIKEATHILTTEKLAKRHDSSIEDAVEDGVILLTVRANNYDLIVNALSRIRV